MNQRALADDARRASAGDADALQRLIVHCHDTLRRAVAGGAAAALAHRIDPDDVRQQVYVAAFEAMVSPSGGRSAPADGG